MDNWQKEHIRRNLVELNENIRCTDRLIDYLISEGCLATAERSHINEFGHDEEAKARNLLHILETRTSGYQGLARSLYKCWQTGALIILLYGIEANITNSNAFRYCGIKLDTSRFLSMPVEFGGLRLLLGELCCNIHSSQNVIADSLDVTTFKELISGISPVIMLDTIPEPLSYYIPRSIWIKSKLDEKFFSETDKDVFLIEDIEWHQLTQLAAKHTGGQTQGRLTDISSNQLEALKVRFILLEHAAHFAKIATKYQKIVHWIRYKNGAFYHVKTSGKRGISFVQKYLIRSEENTVNQSIFVSSCLTTSEQNIVVLYDSPGMGKTVLLSDLAREFKKLHPTNIVVWKHCSDLVKMQLASPDIIPTIEKIKEEVTKVITVNKFGSLILHKILNTSIGKLYLFLDAFDELSSDEQQTCIRILKCIGECHNNLKVVITSRPHGAESLEALTGILGYNILPFQESDQVLFFLEYWNQQHSIKRTCALQKFARHCIKTFTVAVSSEEREITGIPLQCRMLADIYADDAKAYNVNTSRSSEISLVQLDCKVNSLFKMYEDYVNVKFSLLKSKEEKELYLRFHFEQAIELIFQRPLVILKSVVDETTLYLVGIMELRNGQPAFVHRTFAEFLSAKFVMSVISEKSAYDLDKNFQTSIIPAVFSTEKRQNLYRSINNLLTFSIEDEVIFKEKTFHFFLNNFLKRNFNNNFSSRVIGTLDRLGFTLMSEAALDNNCEYAFEFLISWFAGLNVINLEVATNLLKLRLNAPEFSSNFLISHNQKMLSLSAMYCSVCVVEKICNLLLSLSGKKWCEFEYNIWNNPLLLSIRRGNYQMVEYFISISGPQYLIGLHALRCCTKNSRDDSDSTIANKVQIIKLLLQQYSECGTGVHEDLDSADSYLAADFKLIAALIEAAPPLEDTTNKQNIAHIAAGYYSEKEYHELVTILIAKGQKDLFNRRDYKLDTPLHFALRGLDIWTETLDLLASKCQVTFNNANVHSETELYVATKWGRSQRVIDDIVRLGGDIIQAKRTTKKRCTCL